MTSSLCVGDAVVRDKAARESRAAAEGRTLPKFNPGGWINREMSRGVRISVCAFVYTQARAMHILMFTMFTVRFHNVSQCLCGIVFSRSARGNRCKQFSASYINATENQTMASITAWLRVQRSKFYLQLGSLCTAIQKIYSSESALCEGHKYLCTCEFIWWIQLNITR